MDNQTRIKRRRFLRLAGRTAAATIGISACKPRRAHARLSANEKTVVALIGCGGMGNHHLKNLLKRNDVEVAAVCDVYIPRHAKAAEQVGGQCRGYQDYRRILDRQDIDAIWVATPSAGSYIIGGSESALRFASRCAMIS